MGFIPWIVVGLIAGWLACQVMKGGGYGVLMDIILGILGGVLGGWVFGLLGIWPGDSILGAIIVSFVGAIILVAITRLLKRAWLHFLKPRLVESYGPSSSHLTTVSSSFV